VPGADLLRARFPTQPSMTSPWPRGWARSRCCGRSVPEPGALRWRGKGRRACPGA